MSEEFDVATIMLIITGIGTLASALISGISQAIQALSSSKTENKRLDVEEKRAQADGFAQSAQAIQSLHEASRGLLDRIQAEIEECKKDEELCQNEFEKMKEEHNSLRAQMKGFFDIIEAQFNSAPKDSGNPCGICLMRNEGFVNMIHQIRESNNL